MHPTVFLRADLGRDRRSDVGCDPLFKPRELLETAENVGPVGGNWYVRSVPQPREIDTIYYSIFYKRRGHFEPVEDLASEYRFVPPDCLVYRGLKVSGRPMFAMCGYRAPVESYDTTRTGADLLAMARINPTYGNPGRVIR